MKIQLIIVVARWRVGPEIKVAVCLRAAASNKVAVSIQTPSVIFQTSLGGLSSARINFPPIGLGTRQSKPSNYGVRSTSL